MLPTIFDSRASEKFLNRNGFSSTDPTVIAATFIASEARQGKSMTVRQALPLAHEFIYDHANRRDEYSQRLLNSAFFATECGLHGCGPEGVSGDERGDRIVFFRRMPSPMAVRRCEDGTGVWRFVGIVQMEGQIDGSIYERDEIKKGNVELFRIV